MEQVLTTENLDEATTQCDADFRDIQGLTWLPWVGQRFFERPLNKRLLIVGESHYFKNPVECKERSENFQYTRVVVSEALVNFNPECSTLTLDNIPKLLFKTSEIDRRKFWADTAYYNLVQRLMDNSSKPAKRPYGDDFIAGWKVFKEVIKIIQPSHCLFIGVSAAKTFDISMGSQNLSFENVSRSLPIGGICPRIAKLEIDGITIKLIFVHHLGWCKCIDKWHDYLQKQHADLMNWLEAESYVETL